MTVALLDAYNLLFRSFASLPSAITAGDGQPINAVYGMLAFLVRLIRERELTHAIAAFDMPEVQTFRQELYPRYQAQRGPLGGENADDFRRQVGIAQSLLPRLGIPAVSMPRYEADDVIGSAASTLAAAGRRVMLVSADRDLLQLVAPNIEVLVPGKNLVSIVDAEGVRERFGVLPGGVTAFKALAGDASDNIPGLPGIGVKTAVSLVNQFVDLDSIYANIESLPPRPQRILRAGQGDAYLFRQIATIAVNLDIDISYASLPQLNISPVDRPRQVLDREGYGGEKREESGTPGGIRTPDL